MAKDNKKKVEQITDMELDFARGYRRLGEPHISLALLTKLIAKSLHTLSHRFFVILHSH